MKRIHATLLVFSGLFVGFLCGAAFTTAHTDEVKYNYDQVVARIGDTTLTRGQLAEFVLNKDGSRMPIGLELLTGELQDKLLATEAARRAGVTVTAEELRQRIEVTYNFAQNALAKQRLDAIPREKLEDSMRTVMLVEKMMKLNANDKEAQSYYASNPKLFRVPPMAQLIFIDTKSYTKATEALNRLKNGEDAKALAKLYTNGELIPFKAGTAQWIERSSMLPDVATKIFDANDGDGLKAGQYTDVITSQFPDKDDPNTFKKEYLVIYVVDRVQSYRPTYDKVRDAAMFYARAAKYQQVAPEWFAQQAATLGAEWQQVQDLSNPLAPLTVTPISPTKYVPK